MVSGDLSGKNERNSRIIDASDDNPSLERINDDDEVGDHSGKDTNFILVNSNSDLDSAPTTPLDLTEVYSG